MATYTLLPVADYNVGDFVNQSNGTTDLYQVVDEGISGANDSDYVRSVASTDDGALIRFTMGNLPDNVTSITSISVTVRKRSDTGKGDFKFFESYRIYESDGSTPLTGLTNIGGNSFTFANYNTNPTITGSTDPADWQDVIFELNHFGTSDSTQAQLSAFQIVVTYESEILLPVSQVSIGSWTDQSAGTTNIWQAIDEGTASPNDSDYITTSTDADLFVCQIENPNGSTGTVSGITIRVRHRATNSPSGRGLQNVRIYASDGTTPLTAAATHGFPPNGSFTTFEYEPSISETDLSEWTNARLHITSDNSDDSLQVSAVEVELEYFVASSSTYDETASGGIEGGGAAVFGKYYNETASGGIEGGGEVPHFAIYNITAIGGVEGAGIADEFIAGSFTETGSGGAVAGGEGDPTGVAIIVPVADFNNNPGESQLFSNQDDEFDNLYQVVDEGISGANDADYVKSLIDAENAAELGFVMDNLPPNADTIISLTTTFRHRRTSDKGDRKSFEACRLYESDGTTPLTGIIDLISSTTFTNYTSNPTITGSTDIEDWLDAVIVFDHQGTNSAGHAELSAFEFEIVYTTGIYRFRETAIGGAVAGGAAIESTASIYNDTASGGIEGGGEVIDSVVYNIEAGEGNFVDTIVWKAVFDQNNVTEQLSTTAITGGTWQASGGKFDGQSGATGGHVDFTAQSNFIDADGVVVNNEFTVAMWVRFDSSSGDLPILDIENGGGSFRLRLEREENGGDCRIRAYLASTLAVTANDVKYESNTTWKLVIWRQSPTDMELHVDGSEAAISYGSLPGLETYTPDVRIGGANVDITYLVIWNEWLTDGQLDDLWNEGDGLLNVDTLNDPIIGAEIGGEAEIEGNTIFTEVAAGGIEGGGEAIEFAIYNITPTGGVEAGGTDQDSIIKAPPISGGIEGGGLVEVYSFYYHVGIGGAEVAGQADQFVEGTYNETGSGGIEGGGDAVEFAIYSVTSTGGAEAGGEAVSFMMFNYEATNGLVAGGEVPHFAIYNITATGGAEVGGEGLNANNYDEDTSGGIEGGGEAPIFAIYNITAIGGIEGGGEVPIFAIYNITATGGVVVGGENNPANIYDLDTSGGVEGGGEAPIFAIYNITATGGVETGGLALVPAIYNITALGGIEGGGEGVEFVIYTIATTGGAEVGGEGINVNNYDEEITGGIEGGGEALIFAIYNIIATGGVEAGGLALVPAIYNIITTGGAEAGGIANDDFTDQIATSGGVVAGGAALVDTSGVFVEMAEGGIEGGGDGVEFVAYNIIPTGGVEAGGEAPVDAFEFVGGLLGAGGASVTSFEKRMPTGGAEAGGEGVVTDATLTKTVFDGSDDGYWTQSGSFNNIDPVVLAGSESSLGSISTFFRFDNIDIPQGTPIGNAYLVLRSGGFVDGDPWITFYANDSDDAIAPTSALEGTIKDLTSESSDNWLVDTTSSGGVVAGGGISQAITVPTSGGVEVGGDPEVSPVERYIGEGGVVVGGDGVPLVGEGGVVAGGTSIDSYIQFGSGGVVVGGDVDESLVYTAGGGVVVGGVADEEFADVILTEGGVEVGGEGALEIHLFFVGGGTITIGGGHTLDTNFRYISTGKSADAPPEFSGVTVGYLNDQNPTMVDIEFDIDITCSWGVDAVIIVDFDSTWNTGRLPLYFYRIVGKPRFTDHCDPITGIGECCKQFVMNVPARTTTDLCEKLRKRRWQWPVSLVQRFSRNAETELIEIDDENCNTLEEVEICNNIICQDFCVDYDVTDSWGISTTHQINAFSFYEMSGQLTIAGIAGIQWDNGFNWDYTATGSITSGGEAHALSNFVTSFGGILGGGEAVTQTSSWRYTGGEWPYFRELPPKNTDQFIEHVSDRNWNNTNNIKLSDDLRATVDTANGVPTKYLVAKDFGFYLPNDAVVVGIGASVERHSSGAVKDNAVYLVVDDEIVSDNLASAMAWPIGTDSTQTYGGLGVFWRDENDPEYLGEWSVDDVNDLDFGLALRVEPTLGQAMSETRVDAMSLTVYWEQPDQHINISGIADVITQNYSFEADGLVLVEGEASNIRPAFGYISTGQGSMGPTFASVIIGGSYGNSLFYEAVGGVTIDGTLQLGQLGLIASGSASVASSQNFYEAIGGVDVSGLQEGSVEYRTKYIASGGISVEGLAGFNNKFEVEGTGFVVVGGEAYWKSNAFNQISDGNAIFVLGGADIVFGTLGTLTTDIGAIFEVLEVAIQFTEETPDIDEAPSDLITECLCAGMGLIMPMTHNMNSNNRLGQFLTRNDFSMSRLIGMKWSQVNDSWIYNQAYEGLGADSQNRELWTIVCQLQCTNIVGGEELETNIWRFSMQIVQKNLSTFADYDTRLVVGFSSDNICTVDSFDIDMNIDTQIKLTALKPEAEVYEFKLHDNIGLFKNNYWMENPNLNIHLSQTGVEELIARYPIVLS